MTADRFKYSN